jgi:predicted NBD/HSP70 family sugar kinase
MQTGDFRLIRNLNEQIVLNLIRENELISSSKLVKITGMRPSTIFNILKELSTKELVINLGKGESTEKGGKRPFLWKLNNKAAYVIGLDLEIGELTAVVLDLGGEVVAKKIYNIDIIKSLDELSQRINSSVKNILKEVEIKQTQIIGLGIAVTGIVDSNNGIIVMTDVVSDINVPIKMIRDKYRFPIMIENNANAAAVGAKWVGVAKGCRNFITVLVEFNTHVGGMGIGLVINDELYRGSSFCAGELNNPLINLSTMISSFKYQLGQSDLLKKYETVPEKIDIGIILDAVKKGDKIATSIIVKLGHIIGRSIAKSVGLLNPEKLILIGNIAELGDIILDPIKNVIELEILSLTSDSLEFVTSKHGPYSVAMGAASLILNDYFKSPLGKMHR